jgi:hypothetical protein
MGATTMQLREGQRPQSGVAGVMRPQRYRSGTVALREIRFQFCKSFFPETFRQRAVLLHINVEC